MGKVTTYKRGIAAFISSEKGQRFFNFAYSIGAAIVIWGALFKILHLPGGNALLSIGMGTEVLMFVLTAFDRPPKEYKWEDVFPVLDSHDPADRPAEGAAPYAAAGHHGASAQQARAAVGIPDGVNLSEEDSRSLSESITKMAAAADQLSRMAELTSATQQYLDQMASIADEMQQLRLNTAALNQVSDTLLHSFQAITQHSSEISEGANGYATQMQALSHNIGGLNTIYEIQLKSVASQLDAIDRVNRGIKDIRDMYEKSAAQSVRYCEETEKMARYMQQLNSVYAKMIHAMTVNMHGPMGATAADFPAPASAQS